MTITIDLSDTTMTTLNERARAEGRPAAELAAEAVSYRFEDDYDEQDFPFDAESVEKLQRGWAEIQAGQTLSLEESRASVEAVLAARHGNTNV